MSYLQPKNYFEGTTSKGTKFEMVQYDAETYQAIFFLKVFGGLFLFGAIAGFMSPFFLLLSLYNFRGRFQIEYPLCIVLSCLFLLSGYNGWFILRITRMFCDEGQINLLLGINLGVMISATFLWLFSQSIAKCLSSLEGLVFRWILVIFVVGMIMRFAYHIVDDITSQYPEWVDKKLHRGKYTDNPIFK